MSFIPEQVIVDVENEDAPYGVQRRLDDFGSLRAKDAIEESCDDLREAGVVKSELGDERL